VPRAPYTLAAREQALTELAAGTTLEQAAPQCRDPDRVADPSTIRRWVWRRVEGLLLHLAAAWIVLLPPTILAWDFRAAAGILIPEPSPP
jgi:membrane glycosyltransferase